MARDFEQGLGVLGTEAAELLGAHLGDERHAPRADHGVGQVVVRKQAGFATELTGVEIAQHYFATVRRLQRHAQRAFEHQHHLGGALA